MTHKNDNNLIAKNRKARFDYYIEKDYEAGISLEGWEIKSLRAGKINLSDAHVIIRRQEAWLLNAQIQPLPTASVHTAPDATRTRKLLLHRKELSQLIGAVERQGYTLIPLNLYWKNNKVKLNLALAKGKKLHDKRETQKDRDWDRSRARLTRKQQ